MSLFRKKPTIVTHNGTFHADDVFAVATLLVYLKKDIKEVNIVRSRDEKDFASADYVVDVGGVHDEEKNRFDHHQAGGAGKREDGVPYASFGLVWKKFGRELLGVDAERLEKLLVESIDAHDSGVEIAKSVKGELYPYTFGRLVSSLNPTWKEEAESAGTKFLEAVSVAKRILETEIRFLKDEEEARKKIVEAYEKSEDKRIVILEKDYPWPGVLNGFPEPLFVIYHRKDGSYGVKAVRDSVLEFKNRKDFPSAWAGKRNEELQKATGISDAIFAHNGRFMAVAASLEGALALAKLALKDYS